MSATLVRSPTRSNIVRVLEVQPVFSRSPRRRVRSVVSPQSGGGICNTQLVKAPQVLDSLAGYWTTSSGPAGLSGNL
jgi:hypothetical protein